VAKLGINCPDKIWGLGKIWGTCAPLAPTWNRHWLIVKATSWSHFGKTAIAAVGRDAASKHNQLGTGNS